MVKSIGQNLDKEMVCRPAQTAQKGVDTVIDIEEKVVDAVVGVADNVPVVGPMTTAGKREVRRIKNKGRSALLSARPCQ